MSHAQSMRALEIAHKAGMEQGAAMREIRMLGQHKGAQRVAYLLREPDEVVGSIRLERLLRAINRYGSARIRKFISSLGFPAGRITRRVRELTERERFAIADALLDHHPSSPADRAASPTRNGSSPSPAKSSTVERDAAPATEVGPGASARTNHPTKGATDGA